MSIEVIHRYSMVIFLGGDIIVLANMKDKTEKNVWDIFSKYIRARDADWRGYCNCISCSIVKNWKEMDAGHYVPQGSSYALKFDEYNVNAQCTACNKYKHGNLIPYRHSLLNKVGEKKVKELEHIYISKTQKKKLNQQELNTMYVYYKQEFDRLSKDKCLYS